MDYLQTFVGYIKEVQAIIPGTWNSTRPIKTSATSAIPENLYGNFALEEYAFFGLVLFLIFVIVIIKYDSYRFFRNASKEIRRDLVRDVKALLDEKLTEESISYLLKNLADQSSQSTQVEPIEFDQSASSISEETITAPVATPKTPRLSRIPVSHFTPVRRSNSDCSPNNKRSDRGDGGTALRSPCWERRNRWKQFILLILFINKHIYFTTNFTIPCLHPLTPHMHSSPYKLTTTTIFRNRGGTGNP